MLKGHIVFIDRFARLGNADRLHKAMGLLPNEKREDIARDYALMPDWIREIGKKCYEELSES